MTELDRRRMLAVAAAGSIVRTAKAAGDAVAFGLIGAGDRGQHLLQRLKRIGSGRCAAICDPHEPSLGKALQRTPAKPESFSDYRRLLERREVAAVIVATPLHTHFPITRDALLVGKHVFCEPPLVFRPEQIEALRALAAERSSQVVQTGFERRYSQFYQTARQMAFKGLLGEVTEIQAQCNRNPGWRMLPDVPRERNWRLFREFSGGLTAELASPQFDFANWVFGDLPEFVTGVGSLEWRRDGRDIYDSVSLLLKYPAGRRLLCSYSSTSRHLPYLGGTRSGCAEVIMGTEGSIEITPGSEEQPALGLWFYEPDPVRLSRSQEQEEMARIAGATVTRAGSGGLPILFTRDQIHGQESLLSRELKYARRWLYSKGIAIPREDRPAVDVQLDSFFESCRGGRAPRADLNAGLEAARAVILSNLAMDEGRRVPFAEIERLSRAKPRKT